MSGDINFADLLKQQQQHLQVAAQALAAQMPQIVFNSFGHSHSTSEFTSILAFGEKPILTLIMPPVVAKTFAISLLSIVKQYETLTGIEIKTVDELMPLINKHAENQNESF